LSLLIRLDNIEKHYPGTVLNAAVLQGITLSIHKGENIAVTGPSGSGKSTLMNILGLLDQPSAGHYHLLGEKISGLTADELAFRRNRTLGFVFQSFFLLPRLNAIENVMLPLLYRRIKKSIARERACELLDQTGMQQWSHHTPDQLSGGQQQRVAIARALSGKPDIILADEPTGALDSENSQKIIDLLFELNRTQQTTLVVISHDPAVYSRFSRIIQLRDGKILP